MPRRPWLGIWVRGAPIWIWGAAGLLLLLQASPSFLLLHWDTIISQGTTSAASADLSSSLRCLLTSHFPGFAQITYLFPMTLSQDGPHLPYPGLHPIQPGQGLTSLQGTLPWTTIFTRIQLEEGRVTGTKKMIHVIDQACFLPAFLGVPY